ncbi:helix-turn-helix domain-containing protein [Streptomyces sp. NPDC059456]|uniref:helix-turn-helix domain-containing protein n=1 Tax=Streptomyces sp. NPDC059456 TaxID=3346838 RepID=UPI0036BCE32D
MAGFTATGGTQKAMADALHISPAALSRYLSGDRIAPRETLRAMQSFLAARGLPLTRQVWEELDALCGQAHLASGSPAVQLAHLKEELTRLRGEHEHAQQVAEARLTGLGERASRLAERLEEALDRARTAEGARQILQAQVTGQDKGLLQAQGYIQQMEAELTRQREQARRLQQEVGVLREQNRRLVEAQQVPGASTQDTAFEATLAAPRARIAEAGEGEQTGTPAERQGARGRQVAPRTPPGPVRHAPTDQPLSILVYDTVKVVVLFAVIYELALAYGAGLYATPGPSIWKLVLAAVVGLGVSLVCWTVSLATADEYPANWPMAVVTCAGPLCLVSGLVTPFLLGTDVLGHWLAGTVGLL